MGNFWWNLVGKRAMDLKIRGYKIMGKTDLEILALFQHDVFVDKRQFEYAKKKLGDPQ